MIRVPSYRPSRPTPPPTKYAHAIVPGDIIAKSYGYTYKVVEVEPLADEYVRISYVSTRNPDAMAFKQKIKASALVALAY